MRLSDGLLIIVDACLTLCNVCVICDVDLISHIPPRGQREVFHGLSFLGLAIRRVRLSFRRQVLVNRRVSLWST